MKVFRPPVGRVLPRRVRRQDAETEAAGEARRERMAFYSGRRWRRLARCYLAAHPVCVWCGRLAEMVDHVVPRRRRPDLAYDPLNLRACCRRCHARQGKKMTGGG